MSSCGKSGADVLRSMLLMAVDTTTQVTMPAMGESVTEGTVLTWLKQEGEHVDADETLVEVSTDKVDAEVPSPVSGVLAKIHAQEGDTVQVGQLLAEIGESERSERGERSEPKGAGPAPVAEPEAPASEEVVDIVTPSGGESVTEGTILEWAVKVGETVSDGQTVVEISTDKVDMELPAPAAGTITEILVEEGATVTVGQVIARMALGAGAPAPAAAPEPSTPAAASTPAGVSPVAARVAAAEGIDLTKVTGTGPRGRITKADVLGSNGSNGATATAGHAETLKGGAAMLARYMDESRAIPTATSFRTITVTTLDGRRKQLKEAGQRVSFTHLIAYAIARAATEQMPVMAHHFEERE